MSPVWFIMSFSLVLTPDTSASWLGYYAPTIAGSHRSYQTAEECWEAAKNLEGFTIRQINKVAVVCVEGYVIDVPGGERHDQ